MEVKFLFLNVITNNESQFIPVKGSVKMKDNYQTR